MIVDKSPLILNEFFISNSLIKVIPFDSETFDFHAVQNNYPIDIDFQIRINKENDDHLIYIKLSINPEENPGYYVAADAVGVFNFDENVSLSEKDKKPDLLCTEYLRNQCKSLCSECDLLLSVW